MSFTRRVMRNIVRRRSGGNKHMKDLWHMLQFRRGKGVTVKARRQRYEGKKYE